jgi:hypothetical protein
MSEISQDRKDRVDVLNTIMHRIENPGLTMEEKVEISLDLQIESTRALKLLLLKDFISKEDLATHCENTHGEEWPVGRIVSSTLKTIVVCATITGWLMLFQPMTQRPDTEINRGPYPATTPRDERTN